ncbi:MAG: DUF4256 domain-containing protein [Clostridia bacterium]|jgi:hypothetical protein
MTNVELIGILENRFNENMNRHKDIDWDKVKTKLEIKSEKLKSLTEMEQTGGEPDVVGFDKTTGAYIFYDCSAESPAGRRNLCYDREGQAKKEKQGINPEGNAIDAASAMGIELLTEEQYRDLQKLGSFDTKTSSWVHTPPEIRKLGGAIFADCRYNHVFIYHNSAESFYGARGFRGMIKI